MCGHVNSSDGFIYSDGFRHIQEDSGFGPVYCGRSYPQCELFFLASAVSGD